MLRLGNCSRRSIPLRTYLNHLPQGTIALSISISHPHHYLLHISRPSSSSSSSPKSPFFSPSHSNSLSPPQKLPPQQQPTKSSPPSSAVPHRDETHPYHPQEITIPTILSRNHHWATHITHAHPNLFKATGTSQAPKILWIGCSDSRVPETTITGLLPGDIFVHRNIANIVHPGDLSCASVVEYGVEHLGVEIVVVCGHEGCGGVGGALGNGKIGGIDTWLLPLRSIRAQFYKELEAMSPAERVTKVVEENVKAGVRTLRENGSVIATQKKRKITVHGLVYDVKTGLLREVEVPESEEEEKVRLACFDTTVSGGH
ncbi:MAG: hypothetical protein MMC33_004193 [Icmadophila ericetorum]|nr:hypothetical protein [Icmadophila ericetorum]